jgi:hypothetical protein
VFLNNIKLISKILYAALISDAIKPDDREG